MAGGVEVRTVPKEELKDYRLRVLVRGRGENHSIDIDARTIPVKNMVGMKMGLFYVDFREVKIEMGQDLLDDLWEEMTWFVTPERVKRAVGEYFEKC